MDANSQTSQFLRWLFLVKSARRLRYELSNKDDVMVTANDICSRRTLTFYKISNVVHRSRTYDHFGGSHFLSIPIVSSM